MRYFTRKRKGSADNNVTAKSTEKTILIGIGPNFDWDMIDSYCGWELIQLLVSKRTIVSEL